MHSEIPIAFEQMQIPRAVDVPVELGSIPAGRLHHLREQIVLYDLLQVQKRRGPKDESRPSPSYSQGARKLLSA